MWKSIGCAMSALAFTSLCTLPVSAQKAPAQQPKAAAANAEGQSNIGPRSNQRTANKPVLDQSPAQVDQMIAGMLAICNEEEAALGKFAADHAKHDDVKKFASMMAKEHGAMAKQLQKWAPEATLTGQDDRASTAAGSSAAFEPLQVHQQIASRSIASNEKSLGAKKGTDFDMAYVGSQCVMHQQMIDKASVLRQYASPDLRAAIDKGIQSAESHLNQTHQLIEELAKAENAGNDGQ